jgi:hypothetical protein
MTDSTVVVGFFIPAVVVSKKTGKTGKVVGRDLFRHLPDQRKNFWDIPDFAGTFSGF